MVAILYNIRSLHNVGSIFRTADAAGVKKIYLCGLTPTPYDEFGKKRSQLAKVSLGAEDYIPWEKIGSARSPIATLRLIDNLKKTGYKILAIEQSKNSVPYYKFASTRRNNQKMVLIVGNEVKGLSKTILNRADKILEIPMHGKKESLNVAVAFGIVVFGIKK